MYKTPLDTHIEDIEQTEAEEEFFAMLILETCNLDDLKELKSC